MTFGADPAGREGIEDRFDQLLSKDEIRDALHLYCQGVDRGDWEAVKRSYHADAIDDHGGYRGDVLGLVEWMRERMAAVEDSTHFLGQSLIEFTGRDAAFAETYFMSRRLVPPPDLDGRSPMDNERVCREVWGRYADDFERRNGRWAVVRRLVVTDARYLSPTLGSHRHDDRLSTWGTRDLSDPSLARRPDLQSEAAK